MITLPAEAWPFITVVFGTIAGGVGYLFRSRESKGNEPMAQCEKRVESAERREGEANSRTSRAEKTAEDAMSKLASTIAMSAEQTAAIREFGTIMKESAGESRRIQERLDTVVRTNEDLRRTILDFRPAWTPRSPEAPANGD